MKNFDLVRRDLADELCSLIAEDDRVRARLAADGSLFEGYNAEMEAVHRVNAARLREIVTELGGWPGRAAVGDEAASAAWRILQHSIGEPAMMRGMLPIVEDAVARGDADAAQLAMLVDRVRVFEGAPQLYGTQVDWDPGGGGFMVPIGELERPEEIDARRRAVGLGPMEWRRPAPPDEAPPADAAAREAEMVAWARAVGWRP